VLGTEPEVIQNYVETGEARIVFWPVLNHGDPSVFSTLAAECVARQDMDAFWDLHRVLFQNQSELWSAGRDYYVEAAAAAGVEVPAFEACYDGGEALEHVLALDETRRARGIFSQPVFDVNGEIFYGSQSFSTFSNVIEAALLN
jgi:protein-disulfide isomerase